MEEIIKMMIIQSIAAQRLSRKVENTVRPEIGDKVILGPGLAAHIVDGETDKPLYTSKEHLLENFTFHKLLAESEAVVVEVFNENTEFICPFCSGIHWTNCKVYFPDIEKTFYTDWTKIEQIIN